MRTPTSLVLASLRWLTSMADSISERVCAMNASSMNMTSTGISGLSDVLATR